MFEEFWELYPRKRGKKHALKAWKRLSSEDQKKALAAIKKQVYWPEYMGGSEKFIPYPSTWLNGARWEDAPPRLQTRFPFLADKGFWRSLTGAGQNEIRQLLILRGLSEIEANLVLNEGIQRASEILEKGE
jgi:hypothetical protein